MKKVFYNEGYLGLLELINQGKNKTEIATFLGVKFTPLNIKMANLSRSGTITINEGKYDITDYGKEVLADAKKLYSTDELVNLAKKVFDKKRSKAPVDQDNTQSENSDTDESEENEQEDLLSDSGELLETEDLKSTKGDKSKDKNKVAIKTTSENAAAKTDNRDIKESTSRLPNNTLGDRFKDRAPKPSISMDIKSPDEMSHVFKNMDVKKRVDYLMELMDDSDSPDVKEDFRNLALKLMKRAMR